MPKQLRWFVLGDLIFIVLMMLLADLLAAAGIDRGVALTATTTLILVAIIVLLTALLNHHRTAPALQRIRAGEHWLHWRYAHGEWRDLLSHPHVEAYHRSQEATVGGAVRTVAMYSLSAGAVGLMLGFLGSPLAQALQVGLITGGVVAVVSGLYALRNYRRAQSPPPSAASEVFVSALGVALPDHYISLAESNVRLSDVRLESGEPSVLLLDTQFVSPFSRAVTQTTAIPVPPGHEAEAQQLVERFQAENLHT